jgi:SAM-dependent methyltransferase
MKPAPPVTRTRGFTRYALGKGDNLIESRHEAAAQRKRFCARLLREGQADAGEPLGRENPPALRISVCPSHPPYSRRSSSATLAKGSSGAGAPARVAAISAFTRIFNRWTARAAPVKRDWIVEHLRCPTCGGERESLFLARSAIECKLCGADYPVSRSALNMLPTTLRERYNIDGATKVSDHPYDAIALQLIDAARGNGGMALDCGSGSRTTVFPHLVQLEIGAFPNVDVIGANQALPFLDESFEAVISLNVLEHVDDPFLAAAEIRRVLRPGGMLYVDVPFMQTEHGYPEHYFNVTRMGLRKLFARGMTFERHWVPNSGHPLYTLYFVLHSDYAGLPQYRRASFEGLTMREILEQHPKTWYKHWLFTEFSEAQKWKCASTTRALIRKDGH